MRLLNAETFQLEQFFHRLVPPYAILSHTWTGDEVTFQEFPSLSRDDPRLAKAVGCCRRALMDGIIYVWVDTFCIDKASSAELSEAINSMYKWYGDSKICYVYLSDVHPEDSDNSVLGPAFRESRWFTRGWTLQELLAPFIVEFFDSSWQSIGLKSYYRLLSDEFLRTFNRKLGGLNGDLSQMVSEITGISFAILRRVIPLESVSIAEKMSWAASRETTRSEDMAYSLLGIFGINIPLLYGEGGRRAFIRLQEEIIRQTYDHTIFSWGFAIGPTHEGILATSPIDFACCGELESSRIGPKGRRSHYTMTNLGVQIQIPVITVRNGVRYGLFNVKRRRVPNRLMAIPLCRVEDTAPDEDILTRSSCSLPIFPPETWLTSATMKHLYLSNQAAAHLDDMDDFTILTPSGFTGAGYRPTQVHPHATCQPDNKNAMSFGPWDPEEERWALIAYESHIHPAFHLKAKYDKDNSICLLRLARGDHILIPTSEPSGKDRGSEPLDDTWQEVIDLGLLGFLSVQTQRSILGICCILSLSPPDAEEL